MNIGAYVSHTVMTTHIVHANLKPHSSTFSHTHTHVRTIHVHVHKHIAQVIIVPFSDIYR